MSVHRIAILPGDGIGPEIVVEAKKALEAVAERYGHTFEYREALVGAAAIDATGDPFPKETEEVCRWSEAILFGAIGDPKYDNDPKAKVRPEQGLLRMRRALGLFANVRPVSTYPVLAEASPLKNHLLEGVDIVFFRELTGGIYFGEPRGRNEQGTTAYDSCVYSVHEIERIAHLAFQAAQRRDKRLCLVDKANVLATSRLWREVVQGMASQYPDVKLDMMFVDNAAMKLMTGPAYFDVVLTENMFGDILTDEASVITGSLGMLPSASLGEGPSLFEPIHGSYPQATGKNIANPLATILSAAMLLEYSFGLKTEADVIRGAVDQVLGEGFVTEDIRGGKESTSAVGDRVAKLVAEPAIA